MTAAEFWTRHVFVLASPDSLLRGVHGALVRRLATDGFTPVAARLALANSDMIDDLYADVIAGHWETWRYRLIDAAFSLGPTLAMICRYDGDGDDPHELMRAKKGHQHPHRTSPGELRKDFGAINSILGVMHASDDPEESRKDAWIFGLTPDDADAQAAGIASRIALLCALTEPASPEQRDFDTVLGELRASIVVAKWDELGDSHTVDAVAALLEEPARLGAPKAGAELAALLDGRLPADLLDVVRCDFTPETKGDYRAADLFATIRRHGVELDRWQRIVLETSLYFPPARRP